MIPFFHSTLALCPIFFYSCFPLTNKRRRSGLEKTWKLRSQIKQWSDVERLAAAWPKLSSVLLKPANSRSALQPADWPYPVNATPDGLRARSVSAPRTDRGEPRPDGQWSHISPACLSDSDVPELCQTDKAITEQAGLTSSCAWKWEAREKIRTGPATLNEQLLLFEHLLEGIRAEGWTTELLRSTISA